MKRRLFLSLLAAIGIAPSDADIGAFALPPGRRDDPEAEMPAGYQLYWSYILQWGTGEPGSAVRLHLEVQAAPVVVTIRDDDKLSPVTNITGTGFTLGGEPGQKVGWIAVAAQNGMKGGTA